MSNENVATETSENDLEKTVVEKVTTEIKLDKESYSPQEVADLIQLGIKRGAVVSKNQLQDDLKAKSDKIKSLVSEKAELEKKISSGASTDESKTQLEELNAQLNATKSALEETTKKLTVMEDAGSKAIEGLEDIKKEQAETRRKLLATHKEKLLLQYKDQLAGEITGDTEEALTESAKKAHEAYMAVEKNLRTKLNLPEEVKPEGSSDKKVTVERISMNKRDATDWEARKKEITRNVYREAGFNV